MRNTFKSMAVIASFATAALAFGATPANAQQTIRDIINSVEANKNQVEREMREREAEFKSNTGQQTRLLREARQELAGLEAQAARIQRTFDSNQREIDDLEDQLTVAQGEFGELFGQSRARAGEFAANMDSSLISTQYPDRSDVLHTVANSKKLPSSDELNAIWGSVLDQMESQREIATYTAEVAGAGDAGETVDVTRVGPFAVFDSNGEFLSYNPGGLDDEGQFMLSKLPKQPTGELASAANSVLSGAEGSVVTAPIDPTRGNLLRALERVPNLAERISYGKTIGYIILILLAIGVAFGLFRLVMLFLTAGAVKSQKRKSTPSKSNPLGRIMMAYEDAKSKDADTVELKLDEAILRESPKLEFGLNFLKLAAGIAPLLGLLGTVTGMINTFQAMMIFGAGDAQRMAGGISEALVTTMLGLIAAIPLLIIHSFCASMARGVQSTLEEQAAGIVARHIESKNS